MLEFSASDGEIASKKEVTLKVTVGVGIDELESNFRMYPKPVRDILNIEMVGVNESLTQVKIFNLSGKAVYNGEFADERIALDVSAYENGLYFLHIRSDGQSFTRRFNIVK